MRVKKLPAVVVFIAVAAVLSLIFSVLSFGETTTDEAWYVVSDSVFRDKYNDQPELSSLREESFVGVLHYRENCGIEKGASTTLQRCNPYTLNGMSLYPVREDFFENAGIKAGDTIEVIGKKYFFNLEGHALTEIFVNQVRLVD